MAYQLGIDLGTTFTCAAVCRSSDRRWGEPEVVTLGSRGATVPSVVFVGPDGSMVVGEAAERRALTDPDRVVREFKRRIGDPTPLMVANRPWAPQDLSSRLVRWVVDRVAEREGGPADRIAVTHPAAWGQHKKELLAGALANQGLTVTFLAEPQAAAMSYAANERVGAGSTIAVYDFGGGTFDAAIVRKGDVDFRLVGRPEGLERLGGIDFDQAVFEHVLEGMPDAFAQLDDTDPAVLSAVARIRRECTEAKEALSSDTEVSIPVLLPSARGSVRLHRSEFEAMIGPQVEDTVAALRSAVISAGYAPDQLSAVLLVGGSSRIPLVAQLVSEQLGRPVAVDADPKNAIAKGAALSLVPQQAAPAGPPMQQGPPPARPPHMAPPPPGAQGIPYGGPYTDGPYNDGPRHGGEPVAPPRGGQPGQYGPPPARPAPEPAAAMLAAPTRQSRHAQQQEPEWDRNGRDYDGRDYDGRDYDGRDYAGRNPGGRDYDDYDDYDDRQPDLPAKRRPNLMAIGLGALLAVGAVVAAIILWPTGSGTPTEGAGAESSLSNPEPENSGGGGSGGSGSDSGGGAAPVEPPADEATSAPATSAEEAAPTTTKTTTKASEPTEEPDSGSDSDSGGDSESDAGGDSDSGSESGSDSNAAGPAGDVEQVGRVASPADPGL
jgi:actin-like ATPase involved in cell morphogenesis